MNKELEIKLVKKYPKLFLEYGGSPRQTCMAWGCECGDGWYNILDKLCEVLSKYDGVRFAQIKEKFGALRVYVNGQTEENYDEIEKLISTSESLSVEICEICGKPGIRINKNGWLSTECDKCRSEQK